MSSLHFFCVVKRRNVHPSDCNDCDFCYHPSEAVRSWRRQHGQVTLLPKDGVVSKI